jgi:hypothetical protein
MELKESTFVLFAAQHYNNPSCLGTQDFLEDLNRFKYIIRLLNKYKKTGELCERLLLNHIILLHNVFDDALVPMLFLRVPPLLWPQLKTFLVYLNYLPPEFTWEGQPQVTIPLDTAVVKSLRTI